MVEPSVCAPCAISIHALRKESDVKPEVLVAGHGFISIHALRKESDVRAGVVAVRGDISIHALRKESDRPVRVTCVSRTNFNPRSP